MSVERGPPLAQIGTPSLVCCHPDAEPTRDRMHDAGWPMQDSLCTTQFLTNLDNFHSVDISLAIDFTPFFHSQFQVQMPKPDHIKFSHSACRTRDLPGKWTTKKNILDGTRLSIFTTPHSTQAPSVICGELGREISDANRPNVAPSDHPCRAQTMV